MKTGYWIKHVMGTFLFFAVIFISAGKLWYWQGLVYVFIGLVMVMLNYTVLRIDVELLEERSKPGEGTKKWDKYLLGLSFLVTVSMYIVAGLDSGRYHWSPQYHWSFYFFGIILTASGQLLFLIAQKQNRFFSSTVRMQTNREHTVCNTGLYSFVRHPAYLGMVIQTMGFPFIFGSQWSFIPAGFLIVIVVVRTYFEDKTLKNELAGYNDYSVKTHYRVIPYIW